MTSDSELFESNLIRWKAFWPEQVALWQLAIRYAEKHNLTKLPEIAHIPPHFDEQSIDTHTQALYIYGIGSGHLDPFLFDWLNQSPQHQLILLEENVFVIDELLQSTEGEFLLHHPQIWLGFIPPFEKEPTSLEEICKYFFDSKAQTLCHQDYRKQNPSRCFEIAAWVDSFHELLSMQAKEYYNNSTLYDNFYHNFLSLARARYGHKLKKTFENIPAIICGAGPSLDKQIPLLKEARSKALIFAGGSALNALNAYSIVPHFAIATDPNYSFFSRQLMNEAYETPLFYSMRVNRNALQLHVGDLIYLGGDASHHYVRELLNRLGIYKPLVDTGWSVVTNGVSIAAALGCDPIIVIGSDLAYSAEKSYSKGVRSHPLIEASSMITKRPNEELVSTLDIYGKPIQTHHRWKGESLWYQQFKHKFPQKNIWNATEGGLGLKAIPNIEFKTAVARLEDIPRDLDGLVNAAIESAQMPQYVSEEAIRDYLFETEKGLEDCQQVVQREGNRYLKFFKMLPQEFPPFLTDEELLDCPAFINDDTYHHYLEIFNRYFIKRNLSQIRRLEIDGEDIATEEFLHLTYLFVMRRYQELFNTIKAHLKTIKKFLNQHKTPAPLIYRFNPVPSYRGDPWEGALYSYDNKQLIIKDPVCELEWTDPANAVEKTGSIHSYYPDGSLRHEAYLFDHQLHGPSSCFHPEGVLLSKRWFIQGEVQGRAVLYYYDGRLKSRQFFKNGLWHGTQYFYYPLGTPKSELPYQNGLLHGAVKIFDSDGSIRHEISFHEGKRHGREYYWANGQIHFEANYVHGTPEGNAHRYHSNGNLAVKASYDSNGKLLELLKLTPEGLPKEVSGITTSYFDIISEQTTILSNSLQQMAESIPFLLQAKGYNRSVTRELLNEIDHLQESIVKMKLHADELQKISSETLFDKGEPIWKTPTTHIQLQLLLTKNLQPLKEQVERLIQVVEQIRSSLPPKAN